MPTLQQADLLALSPAGWTIWQEMLRSKDRHDRDMLLRADGMKKTDH